MTDNIVRREVQRRDDPFGIPACFYWTIDEVADWVESIGYSKYKENFRSHFINGRKLLTVDACVLPKMGITHFGDILSICCQIQELASIRRAPFSPYYNTTNTYLFHHDIRKDAPGPSVFRQTNRHDDPTMTRTYLY
ncbi:sterile alpha motif domain-containing protein 15 [Biomphalaria glabrata]|nr:sterile alpha motif domain-containing protein 15-like isoform X1 [Biomphalaria glabrata]